MTIAARFVVVPALCLLAESAAFAQPPPAPPPHPPLAELVKEYVRFGLPLPPPCAPLVKIRRELRNGDDSIEFRYLLGFPRTPVAIGRDPRYLVGSGQIWTLWIPPHTVEPVDPTPDCLQLPSQMDGHEFLFFAIQCHWRGWHEFADLAYAKARELIYQDYREGDPPPPTYTFMLRDLSFELCEEQFNQPGGDRKAILRRLREKIAEEPGFRGIDDRPWFHQLERTAAPRRSKPGTVEALIDDLTEYWEDRDNPANKKGQEAYRKLAALGFDAVPALINHLTDDRFSRAKGSLANGDPSYDLTVGHLCSRLLFGLSAKSLKQHDNYPGVRIDPNKARAWFAEARKIGEEKWLVDHAPVLSDSGESQDHLVHLIGVKYPARLPAVYRAILQKPPSRHSDCVEAILASKLTRDQKIALFEEGANHTNILHRTQALMGLANLDRLAFRKHFLALLKDLVVAQPTGKASEFDLNELLPPVERADDSPAWNQLAIAATRSSFYGRVMTIRSIDPQRPPDEPDPIRRHRLRFLLHFLDDRSAGTEADDPWYKTEVRDLAAAHLAGLFRFPVGRWGEYDVDVNLKLGPITRLLLREAVRELAKRELARPGK